MLQTGFAGEGVPENQYSFLGNPGNHIKPCPAYITAVDKEE